MFMWKKNQFLLNKKNILWYITFTVFQCDLKDKGENLWKITETTIENTTDNVVNSCVPSCCILSHSSLSFLCC